jgi:hypothetical protein
MRVFLAWRRRISRVLLLSALAGASGSCVQAFDGSWTEFVLGTGVQTAGEDDANLLLGQPPSETHYEMWVVTGQNAFKVREFQVVRQIDRSFPCFIEEDEARYPGLHSTQVAVKTREDVLADGDPADGSLEVGLIADAEKRVAQQEALENDLKAVVEYDPTVTPEIVAALAADVPAIGLIDDASNATRRQKCKAFFAAHPNYYVGNDEVFALPFNGIHYGMVDGVDPRNAAFLGGAGFAIPATFKDFDQFWINWQFNDTNPATNPRIDAFGPSATGYHYLRGEPQHRNRRVINIPMTNDLFGTITAEVAIYPGIDEDSTHF